MHLFMDIVIQGEASGPGIDHHQFSHLIQYTVFIFHPNFSKLLRAEWQCREFQTHLFLRSFDSPAQTLHSKNLKSEATRDRLIATMQM